jgi:uncharacterized membrane protein
MQGSISISLIELFAYLFPGSVTVAALIYRFIPIGDIDEMAQRVWVVVVFVTVGYVIGHLLTLLSVYVLKLRMFIIKKILKQKSRQERLSFYSELSKSLHLMFGANISPEDEYLLSLRLIGEYMPNSIRDVDRLYALTLFSRNLVLTFFIIALLFIGNWVISAIAWILSALFLVRYSQLEASTGNTVARSAYVLLCMNKDSKKAISSK